MCTADELRLVGRDPCAPRGGRRRGVEVGSLRAGLLARATEPGAVAAPRHVLTLTEARRRGLCHRLAEPDPRAISDENRWFTVLAFLRHPDDAAARSAVLRRRLAFIEEPASFFYDGDRPLPAEELDDPFRRGILTIARATSRAELSWLRETIASLGD
ncbi:PadR family transcriptional regulator [Streptomyces sp. NPDC093591]|uniref:PadR family transcriptional regulator n=1 Tax=Streptomyces sp. NPDC093591 TaxID=3366044 RepID=UPI00380D84D1